MVVSMSVRFRLEFPKAFFWSKSLREWRKGISLRNCLSIFAAPFATDLISVFTQMCFNQRGDISTLNDSSLKLVNMFTFLGSNVSSTETDINTLLAKAWTAIDRLSVIWKSDLTDKIKRSIFEAAVVSILLYRCTTWTLTKRMEKKLDGNYTRILRAILNKSWRQHPTKQQLYSHLPSITETIQIRQHQTCGTLLEM